MSPSKLRVTPRIVEDKVVKVQYTMQAYPTSISNPIVSSSTPASPSPRLARFRTLGHLPPELLDPILRAVCTDGGRTVNALRLSDRATHTSVEPYRFRNVAASGMPALECLVHELTRTTGEYQAMEHLLVSDSPRYEAESPRSARYTSAAALRFDVLLNTLLQLVRPHLRTLTLLVHNPRHRSIVPSVLSSMDFPALELFTLRFARTYFLPHSQQRLAMLCQPALRRVVLDFPVYLCPGHRYLADFAAGAPALEDVVLHARASLEDLAMLEGEVYRLRLASGPDAWPPVPVVLHPWLDATVPGRDAYIALFDRQAESDRLGVQIRSISDRPTYSVWRGQWMNAVEAGREDR
jgi:hypothetical protein